MAPSASSAGPVLSAAATAESYRRLSPTSAPIWHSQPHITGPKRLQPRDGAGLLTALVLFSIRFAVV